MIRREPITKMKEWILCDTCKIAMKSVNRRARAMRDAMKDRQLEEEHYSNITRYLCQPYHDHGEWITTYDVVRKKKGLSLEHKEVFGRCSHECESIAFACAAIVEEFWEEIPEALFSKMSTAKLQSKICRRSCKEKKRRHKHALQAEWGAEAFEEIAEDQKQMFRQFVGGELYKQEQKFNGEMEEDKRQQDALQRYAEAYVEAQETEKEHKAAKCRSTERQNKKRADKGLPLLEVPEHCLESGEEDGEGDGAEGDESVDEADENDGEPKIKKIEL